QDVAPLSIQMEAGPARPAPGIHDAAHAAPRLADVVRRARRLPGKSLVPPVPQGAPRRAQAGARSAGREPVPRSPAALPEHSPRTLSLQPVVAPARSW